MAATKTGADTVSKELMGLVKLVSFFKMLRHKDNLDEASFYFINDLYNIVPYKQALVWTYDNHTVKLQAASGQADISEKSPFAQFLKHSIQDLVRIHENQNSALNASDEGENKNKIVDIQPVNAESFKSISDDMLKEWLAPNTFCVYLRNHHGELLGGIWIERGKALTTMAKALLEDAGDAFSCRLDHFKRNRGFGLSRLWASTRTKIIVMICLLIFCLWPVHFSATSKAEIVPEKAEVISVPFGALVSKVHVAPNDQVIKDQLLFTLDRTQLENEYALAKQKLETVKSSLSKTQRESFADPTKRPQINILKEEIKLKQLELDYAEKRLALADIRAQKSGIILFSDANDILGKPVKAGEKVMTLASSDNVELLVRIPSDGMIDIDYDVPIKFFLNIDPLKSHQATIYNLSYQPTKDADGILSYKARAQISDEEAIERIGLTGTAKVYGAPTLMIVNLLRRPFIALRNLTSF